MFCVYTNVNNECDNYACECKYVYKFVYPTFPLTEQMLKHAKWCLCQEAKIYHHLSTEYKTRNGLIC